MTIKTITGKFSNHCYINICRKKICDDLKFHGIYNNKTFILKPPNIDKNLHRYYILGYWDGDGGLSFSNIKTRNNCLQCMASFTGTKEICEWIEKFFNSYDVECSWSKRIKNNSNNYTLSIGGNEKSALALSILYEKCDINFLKRKFNRYSILKNKLLEKHPFGFYIRKIKQKYIYDATIHDKRFTERNFETYKEAYIKCIELFNMEKYYIGIVRLNLFGNIIP